MRADILNFCCVPSASCLRFFYNESNAALVYQINISGAEGARRKEMATKSSKPRKTTSAKQGAQQKSTVTPIGQGSNIAESSNRSFQSADHRLAADQRIQEEIRIRAYELFEQRGRLEGFHDEDWARAEAEVLAKYRRDKSA
jgi:sugar diacid utilization regulator